MYEILLTAKIMVDQLILWLNLLLNSWRWQVKGAAA